MPLSNFAKDTIKSMKSAVIFNPALRSFALKAIKYQKEAAKKRDENFKKGLTVPSFLIFSITNRCNLSCKGCYFAAQKRKMDKELTDEKIDSIISEASELGTGVVVIAGGEPLNRPKILEVAEKLPNIIFLLFTNGTLLNDGIIEKLNKLKNIVTIFSIEGHEKETDLRRGQGIYKIIKEKTKLLKTKKMIFGYSLTVTKNNLNEVTDKSFIDDLLNQGGRVFFFGEYIPIKEGTKEWVPTKKQREYLKQQIALFRKTYSAVFFTTADEDEFGGCQAAGRGFIHINPQGDIEPCPMSPFSDVNLNDVSLAAGLKSKFLAKIRENPSSLEESEGGCALWDRREWVKSILKS